VAFLSSTFTIKQTQEPKGKRDERIKKRKEKSQWNVAVRAAPLYTIKND
jgi:hypothetical protein